MSLSKLIASATNYPTADRYLVQFHDGHSFHLVRQKSELTDDMEVRALKKRFGVNYKDEVARSYAERNMHPILRMVRV